MHLESLNTKETLKLIHFYHSHSLSIRCIPLHFQDLTVTFPPNSITVILSAASAGVSTYGSPSQILESIWGEGGRVAVKEFGGNGYGETHTPGSSSSSSNSNGNVVEQTGGCVWVHGRELEEWSLSALRNRITYLKQGDLDLALPAGEYLSSVYLFIYQSRSIYLSNQLTN